MAKGRIPCLAGWTQRAHSNQHPAGASSGCEMLDSIEEGRQSIRMEKKQQQRRRGNSRKKKAVEEGGKIKKKRRDGGVEAAVDTALSSECISCVC